MPASAIERLHGFPGIVSVRLDEVIQAPEITAGGSAPIEWNIEAVNAPTMWDLGFTGTGVVVASMDTGVDVNHLDLINRWRGRAHSWFDPNGEHSQPHDKAGLSTGHGTGTMALMVGGDATTSAIGMAPGAQWIAAKIFNDAGDASTSAIHQGFQWLLENDFSPKWWRRG